MAMEYFVEIGMEKRGPFLADEIRRRFAAGEFPTGSRYWAEGWAEWRRLDELPLDVMLKMLDVDDARENGLRRSIRAVRSSALVSGLAVLAVSCAAWWWIGKVERVAEETDRALRRQIDEVTRESRRESDARLAEIEQMRTQHLEARRCEEAKRVMNADARLLAGAAQQYFLESVQTSVAVSYDLRTGALGGPLASYVPRLSPGYRAVPECLTLEGKFVLDHPNAGAARTYFADGRPAEVWGATGGE